jgi:hypothetical protein
VIKFTLLLRIKYVPEIKDTDHKDTDLFHLFILKTRIVSPLSISFVSPHLSQSATLGLQLAAMLDNNRVRMKLQQKDMRARMGIILGGGMGTFISPQNEFALIWKSCRESEMCSHVRESLTEKGSENWRNGKDTDKGPQQKSVGRAAPEDLVIIAHLL